jgi:hypothetical protein
VTRLASIKGADLVSPSGESRKLVLDRTVSIGDVVDLTAESVDRVHPVATIAWQHPHRPIERRSGRFDPMPDRLAQRIIARPIGSGP